MEPTQFFFDVDSTVIRRESLLDVVLEAAGTSAELEQKLLEITNAGMNGDIDFEESLKQRLDLANIRQRHIDTITHNMLLEITDGMSEFMQALRAKGHSTWLLTAGIREMMLPLAQKLGIPETQVFANEPVWTNGRLTGFQPGPMLKTGGKATILRGLKENGRISGCTVMIGDGSSDLAVFTSGAADDFYGFGEHAVRPNVEQHAPHFFRSVAEMRDTLGI